MCTSQQPVAMVWYDCPLFTNSVVESQGTQHRIALGEADEVKQGLILTPAKWRTLTSLDQYSIQKRLPHILDKQGWAELCGVRGRLSLHAIPQRFYFSGLQN